MLQLRLLDELDLGDSLLDSPFQVGQVNRLGCKVESPLVHCRADILHITVGRDHDALQRRIAHLINLSQESQPVHLRHINITQDNVDVRVGKQRLQRLQSVVHESKLVFPLSYLPAEILGKQIL